ncbi:MAG: hypothetical protein JRD69_10015 [Deltaproteobacteria bacterium]|nr:hypothetical protein [Deltaproteobacteria bacterium]
MDAFTAVGGILGGLAGLASCVSVVNANEDDWFVGLIALGIFAAVGAGIGYGIGRMISPKGIKPESHKTKFSSIQELLAEGWEFGDKPPEDN